MDVLVQKLNEHCVFLACFATWSSDATVRDGLMLGSSFGWTGWIFVLVSVIAEFTVNGKLVG